jgi:hypothetical protein
MIAQIFLASVGGWFIFGIISMICTMFTKSWRNDDVESQIQRCNGAVLYGPIGFYFLFKYLITGKSSYDQV